MEAHDRACCGATHGRIDQPPPACDEPRARPAPHDNFPGRRTTLRFNSERVDWSAEW